MTVEKVISVFAVASWIFTYPDMQILNPECICEYNIFQLTKPCLSLPLIWFLFKYVIMHIVHYLLNHELNHYIT